ncbi:MAG: hypothetical protein QF638_02910, partial [Acidimicrobiales bacterium]|nr:hypothetical protein [Acidimicrobiales bacterium]
MNSTSVAGVLLAMFLICLGTASYSKGHLPSDELGSVVSVIDGDTVVIDLAGIEETVRLLG